MKMLGRGYAVHRIANRLADAVIAEYGHGKLVPAEEVELVPAVVVFAQGSLHFTVIAPAAQVQTLVAPLRRLAGQFLQGKLPRAGARLAHGAHRASHAGPHTGP